MLRLFVVPRGVNSFSKFGVVVDRIHYFFIDKVGNYFLGKLFLVLKHVQPNVLQSQTDGLLHLRNVLRL